VSRLVERRIQMPPAVWRHAVLGSRCNPWWAILAVHASHLAEGERLWFEDILRRIPLQPGEEGLLAC
jgi:hypothetical protein